MTGIAVIAVMVTGIIVAGAGVVIAVVTTRVIITGVGVMIVVVTRVIVTGAGVAVATVVTRVIVTGAGVAAVAVVTRVIVTGTGVTVVIALAVVKLNMLMASPGAALAGVIGWMTTCSSKAGGSHDTMSSNSLCENPGIVSTPS